MCDEEAWHKQISQHLQDVWVQKCIQGHQEALILYEENIGQEGLPLQHAQPIKLGLSERHHPRFRRLELVPI